MARMLSRCVNVGIITASAIGYFIGLPVAGLAVPAGIGAVVGSVAGVAMVNRNDHYYESTEYFNRVV